MKKLIEIIVSAILIISLPLLAQAEWLDCSGMDSDDTVTVNIKLASDGSSVVAGGATTERKGSVDSNYYYNFTTEVAGTTYVIECIPTAIASNAFSFTLSGRETFVNAAVGLVATQASVDAIQEDVDAIGGDYSLSLIDVADNLSDVEDDVYAVWTDTQTLNTRLSDIWAGYLTSNLESNTASAASLSSANWLLLTNETYGLAAVQTYLSGTMLPGINDIKGGGWADESLVSIQADLDNPTQYKATGFSTFNPATDEVDIGKVKGVAVTGIADFQGDVTTVAANVVTLLDRLTALRAGYLDNLSGGAVALQSYVDEVESLLKDATIGLSALKTAIGSGGLTAQQVRDAMKLAPTAGAPAAGSVDKKLDNIERHN